MLIGIVLGGLALLSLGLTLWQWLEGCLFPLHKRVANPGFIPSVTILKPLRGTDEATEACLRSWLEQEYAGPVQVLFGVASSDDPVCAVVERLLTRSSLADARLVVCSQRIGVNAKVSTLIQLQALASRQIVVVSDDDVWAPPDLLANLVAAISEPQVGLACPFYRLARPATAAMRIEAVAVDADFWTSVLQARRLSPIDFALGAAMAVRRELLEAVGGFRALGDYLADDFELGHRVAEHGERVALCPVVVECREEPQGWRSVWRHQLRWARTIRVCRPVPYAMSLVTNTTLWPLLWLAAAPSPVSAIGATSCLLARLATACHNQWRLTRSWSHLPWVWVAPIKDLMRAALWLMAFAGNRVEWGGRLYRVNRRGLLTPVEDSPSPP